MMMMTMMMMMMKMMMMMMMTTKMMLVMVMVMMTIMVVVVTMMIMMIWFIWGDSVARLILCFLIMSLCSYEKAGRLAKFSVAQREISARAGDGLLINQTQFLWRKKDVSRASPAYGGGCHSPPHPPPPIRFFWVDKTSVPDVFISCSFILAHILRQV